MSNKKKIFEFDKFVKDIKRREDTRKEQVQEYVNDDPAEPKRKRAKLYQEKWQNRIHWIRK